MLLLLRPPLLAGAVILPGTAAVTFPSDDEGIGTQKLRVRATAAAAAGWLAEFRSSNDHSECSCGIGSSSISK
jgi:hypothetical protein